MKKFISILKKNFKIIIGIIIGLSISATVVFAEILYSSDDVSYDNTNSGLDSSTVQGAIDELKNICLNSGGSGGSGVGGYPSSIKTNDGYYFNGNIIYASSEGNYFESYDDLLNAGYNVFIKSLNNYRYVCINIPETEGPECFKENSYQSEKYHLLYTFRNGYCEVNEMEDGGMINCNYEYEDNQYSCNMDSMMNSVNCGVYSYYGSPQSCNAHFDSEYPEYSYYGCDGGGY